MKILAVPIKQEDKEALRKTATKLGLQLATFCRMVLLRELQKDGDKRHPGGGG